MGDRMFKVTIKTDEGDETIYIKHYIDIVYPCFEQFKQKIYVRYPKLRETNPKMYWMDSESDQVLVFNEEDFRVYVDQVESPKDKFFVDLTSKSIPQPMKEEVKFIPQLNTSAAAKDEVVHPQHVGVICDGCDNNIVGYRYKCLECYDFDLCMKCESGFIHPNHTMLRFYMPAQYVDWSGCKFSLGKFAKCSRKKHCDVAKEMKKSMKHEEKSERRHKHRCHDKNNLFTNIMGYMHDLSNAEGGVDKDETAENIPNQQQTATNHQQAAQQNMEKAFKMFGHFMKPFDVDMEIHGVSKDGGKPEESKKHDKPEKSSECKKQKKMKHDDKKEEEIQSTFFGPSGSFTVPIEQDESAREPVVHQIPITIDRSTDNVPQMYNNPFENVEPKTEFFFLPTNDQKTSNESSIDSEKEWDVIDEEIALENLEKRRNNPPTTNNTGTIPKENLTKNSSTNTSIDDIPKMNEPNPIMTESKESDKKSSAYGSANEGSGKNTGNPSPMLPNFEQLGRDLKKHLEEQFGIRHPAMPVHPAPGHHGMRQDANISERIEPTIIYHPKSHINESILQMIQMGFSNEGGWLTQLLDSVNGNIPKALDLLQPVKR